MVARFSITTLGDHVLHAGNGFDLVGIGRLKELVQGTLLLTRQHGEVVHLVSRCRDAGVIAARNLECRGIADVKRITEYLTLGLQQLQAKAVIGPKAEVVDLVVTGLFRHAIAVVLVRRIAGPAARADREQF